jgi:Protein of unknown function (DUF2688)
MSVHRRIRLIETACRRCGRTLHTASRSITGADSAKVDLDRICESCITPEEQQRILAAQANAILQGSHGERP